MQVTLIKARGRCPRARRCHLTVLYLFFTCIYLYCKKHTSHGRCSHTTSTRFNLPHIYPTPDSDSARPHLPTHVRNMYAWHAPVGQCECQTASQCTEVILKVITSHTCSPHQCADAGTAGAGWAGGVLFLWINRVRCALRMHCSAHDVQPQMRHG